MPVSFTFIDNETKKQALLCQIDDEVAADMGMEPEPVGGKAKFFDLIAEVGISILLQSNGMDVDKEAFDKYLEVMNKERAEAGKDPFDEAFVKTMRKFIYEKYTFRAWR